METQIEYTYYQFMRGLGYPIYIRVPLTEFDAELPNFLKTLNFSELTEEELVEAETILNTNLNARLLTLQTARGPVIKKNYVFLNSYRG